MSLLKDHIEWIFSGIGVAVLGGLWRFFKKGREQPNASTFIEASGSAVAQGQSTAIVGSTINITQGISYEEARDIAKDVFEQNYLKLKGEAARVAEQRASEVVDRFLKRLHTLAPEAVGAVADPDMQYDLFVAQKEFARSGDSQLCDLLVDLLVDRARRGDDSLVRIVLNESLEVAPRLTPDQFDALSLIFLVRYTRFTRPLSVSQLLSVLEYFWGPFVKNASRTYARFQHLEYARCGKINIASVDAVTAVRTGHLPWLCKGFEWSEALKIVPDSNKLQSLLIPCVNDRSKWQLNGASQEEFIGNALRIGLSRETCDQLWRLQTDNTMTDGELQNLMMGNDTLRMVLEYWQETAAKSFELTSVGIAIAHANIRRRLNTEFDLSIWIS